jgi:hypothetical protein
MWAEFGGVTLDTVSMASFVGAKGLWMTDLTVLSTYAMNTQGTTVTFIATILYFIVLAVSI